MNATLSLAAAEWLDTNVDSHGIYSVDILASLPEGIAYADGRLTAEGRTVRLGTMTAERLDHTQGAARTGNPKGAYLDPNVPLDEVVFAGYWLSSALDRLLTGEDAGSQYMGRGFAHRASVEHLRTAANEALADAEITAEGRALAATGEV